MQLEAADSYSMGADSSSPRPPSDNSDMGFIQPLTSICLPVLTHHMRLPDSHFPSKSFPVFWRGLNFSVAKMFKYCPSVLLSSHINDGQESLSVMVNHILIYKIILPVAQSKSHGAEDNTRSQSQHLCQAIKDFTSTYIERHGRICPKPQGGQSYVGL